VVRVYQHVKREAEFGRSLSHARTHTHTHTQTHLVLSKMELWRAVVHAENAMPNRIASLIFFFLLAHTVLSAPCTAARHDSILLCATHAHAHTYAYTSGEADMCEEYTTRN